MYKSFNCILFTLLFTVSNSFLFAQLRPAIQWQKCLGGSADDRANDVLINPDGTTMITGYTYSTNADVTANHGGGDAWVVKLDASGNIIWQKTFGGTGQDYFKTIIATYDNAYLCIGYSNSTDGDVTGNHGSGDAWIVKLNASGNIIWSKCYGGSQADIAVQGIKTIDAAYAIMGTSSSTDGDLATGGNGGWVFKIDGAGNILWTNGLSSGGGYKGYDIILSEDNNIYALASGIYNYVGGIFPNYFNLVSTPGRFFKLDNATGSSNFIADIGADSTFSMCRVGNSIKVSKLMETYFYVEFCYDEDFYIDTKPDGSNSFTSQHIGQQFTRGCTNAFGDGYFTAATHGMAAAETVSGFVAAGSQVKENNFYVQRGWLSDINGFNCSYGTSLFNGAPATGFNSVKVFPSGNDYIVVGYADGDGDDVSGFHGGAGSDCWVLKLSALNRIVGNVFIDANNNNIKDPGELPYTHASIKSTKTGFEQRAFPYNGFYSNTVDIGTFTTTIALNRPYYTVTPASKVSAFTTYKNIDSANFAVHPIPGIIDYAVAACSLLPVRPGFPLQYNINYTNRGTTILTNKDIVFIKDSRQQLVNSVPPYTSIVGDSIKWNIASLPVDGTGNIILNMDLDAMATINDTLKSAVYIDSTSDVYRADNYVSIRERIWGSYDPNDKQEIHGGFITPQELSAGTWLDYTIRFQNTGNDTAFNIILRDTLDTKLELDSIEMIASSHPYQANIKNSRYVAFTFNNIKLVDSIHNEPLSHGYISYRIKPRSTLVVGDTIRNNASIYFDFNPAIKTNTQLTIVRNRPIQVTWTGAISTAWEDAGNWSNGVIPDSNTDVTINTGVPNYPIVNSIAICRKLNVKPGSTVTVKSGFEIKVIH